MAFGLFKKSSKEKTKTPKKDFKYVAKEKISPKKNRYFYTMEEWKAYLNGKKANIQNGINNSINNAKNYSVKLQKNVNNTMNNISNKVDNYKINFAKAYDEKKATISKKMQDISNKLESKLNLGKKFVNSKSKLLKSNVSNLTNESISKGKDFIGKIGNIASSAITGVSMTGTRLFTENGKVFMEYAKDTMTNVQKTIAAITTGKVGLEIAKKLAVKTIVNEFKIDPNGPDAEQYQKEAEADPYDDKFTYDQIVYNLYKSGKLDQLYNAMETYYGKEAGYIMTEKDLLNYLDVICKKSGSTGISSDDLNTVLQELGFIDEKMDDYHPETFDDLKKKTGKTSNDDDMHNVNPNYSEPATYEPYNYGYTNNCAYCTLTYDMRQRGYDVEASSVAMNTNNMASTIENWYEGDREFKVAYSGQLSTYDQVDAIEQAILQESGYDSRGQFCCYWQGGGGHSVSYEIDSSGNVTIRDCQINESFTLVEWMEQYGIYTEEMFYMRTDDLELSDDALVGVKNKSK